MPAIVGRLRRRLANATFAFGLNAMFKYGMDAHETQQLIGLAGGDTEFARLLGIAGDKYAAQRVHNWKRRGMPSAVVLDHYATIQRLRRLAKRKHQTQEGKQ